MNLHRLLAARESEGNPVNVGLIGAGKFASMFLAQVPGTPGMRVVGIADLDPERARANLRTVGWAPERFAAPTLEDAAKRGTTWVGEDALALVAHPAVEVVVEATGNPTAGIAHALAAIRAGKHIVMVNVEADALAGPWLAEQARAAGVVYSLAYGDQPALIAEQVDWARAAGFPVVAAGKGTKYLPSYERSTPDTVWSHYGLTAEQAELGGMNAQMFNSFLDGTKSAIEMAAVANATGLTPAPGGLRFPPCGVDDLPRILRPEADGGVLHHRGQVEVVSSLERDGRPVFRDLRWGVYVVIAGDTEYVRRCFAEYGVVTSPDGGTAALYRPTHFIGLELGISVASAALRREPTGAPEQMRADVAAVAKRDLAPGDALDGEGGYTVFGRVLPAADSLRQDALPIGLAHGVRLRDPVPQGEVVTWSHVEIDEMAPAVQARRAAEAMATRDATGNPAGRGRAAPE